MNAQFLFQVWQCTQEDCRFRFPVVAGRLKEVVCPRCGAPLAAGGAPFAPHRPAPGKRAERPVVEALLDNIRSVRNVGSMFRASDGAGLRRLHLCGITATPEHPKVAKTSLGAESAVPWCYHENALDAARQLGKDGYRLWALESHPRSSSLFQAEIADASRTLLLIVGNERAGVDPALLALCERILQIPMQGTKTSLNVATAFGIAVYHLRFNTNLA